MKRLLMTVLAAAVLGLGGCTQALAGRDAGGGEPEIPAGGGEPEIPAGGRELEISVSAQGFGPDAGQGRSVESGYTTQFRSGDRIGITAVFQDGAIDPEQNNLPFEYNGAAWRLVNTGDRLKLVTGASYFAYYPYNAGNNGIQLAYIKDNFVPQADQSSHDAYTASDLMTWNGYPSTETFKLNITLTHALSLVEVQLPVGSSEGAGIKAGGTTVMSYNFPAGSLTYRCIVKPQDQVTLSGGYNYTPNQDTTTVTWQQVANLKPGQYVKITVQ